ncbi:MAG: dCTP deaminase domain-containing protein [Candidatus Onthomonas sp.]
MLSRRDIEKELGKGINIFPLVYENIKENSINLTIGQNAWTMGDRTIYWYGGSNFSCIEHPGKKRTFTFRHGASCIKRPDRDNDNGKRYLVLLPHTTTIVETAEVIGVGNNIGGALHSKVGIVAKGIGHIGTMLGPGYCGHLMVSLHNITDEVISLPVGSTFVSLSFDYLNTQVTRTSTTVSGHIDKFAELGIKIDEETRSYLTADWKSNIAGIRRKMIDSDQYQKFRCSLKEKRWSEFRKYVNVRNAVAILSVVLAFCILFFIASFADRKLEHPVWVDRFLNVGCSGLIGSMLIGLFRFIKDKK